MYWGSDAVAGVIYGLTVSVPVDLQKQHLSLCLKDQRQIARSYCCYITTFIKISSGMHSKGITKILLIYLYNPFFSFSFLLLCDISRVMDDITQQGFREQHCYGAGISMEPHSPYPAHRFVLLPDPNLLKGPSQWRKRATLQTLGINSALARVFYHPYSSLLSAFLYSVLLASSLYLSTSLGLAHSLNVNAIKVMMIL